ncbi:Hypothetical protein, putative [Bodo saltans]|uniref:Uncharacterized protein n=1 Tax=Bodo saltans TaxID=75058 RepID=A0A0S4IWG7_BODSA|nr:Hypothetical protein, putative [Bodo saltans]|eukprot:CUG28869.1 Hypothetical protein, putative [Bodo saltans]
MQAEERVRSDRTHSDDAGRGEGALHHWNIAAKKNPLVAPMAVGLTEQRPRNVRRPTMEFQTSPAAHLVEVSDVDSTTSSRKTGDGAATATPSGLGPRMFVAANHTPSPATNSFTMVSRHSTGMSQKEGLNETIGPEDLERAQAAVVEDGLDLSLPAATTNSISGERRSEDMTGTLGPSDLARTLPVAVHNAHTQHTA